MQLKFILTSLIAVATSILILGEFCPSDLPPNPPVPTPPAPPQFEGQLIGLSVPNTFCWLRKDHTVWCWGDNAGAKGLPPEILNTGNNDRVLKTASKVRDLPPIQEIGEANLGVFAIDQTGEIYFVNQTIAKISPKDWPALEKMAASRLSRCGISKSGDNYCWGINSATVFSSNTKNLLGTGSALDTILEPMMVQGDLKLHALAGNRNLIGFCGLDATNHANCWGINFARSPDETKSFENFLGMADSSQRAVHKPTPVKNSPSFESLTGGGSAFCGLSDGQPYCWGLNEINNQKNILATGKTDRVVQEPTKVITDIQFSQLATNAIGGYCGLTAQGKANCWGINGIPKEGSIGLLGTMDDKSIVVTSPMPVNTEQEYTQLAGSRGSFCGLTKNDTVECWGNNQTFGDSKEKGNLAVGSVAPVVRIPAVVQIAPSP